MKTTLLLKRILNASVAGTALLWSTTALALPKVGSLTVGAQSPSPVLAGQSATNQVIVFRGTGGGSGGTFKGDMSVTNTVPAGVTITFVPTSLDFTPSDNVKTGLMITAVSPGVQTLTFNPCVKCVKNGDSTDFALSCAGMISIVGTNPPSCSITGPGTVCLNATGIIFSNATDAVDAQFNWSITGNGAIVGSTTQRTVEVDAGASGSFTLDSVVINLTNGKTNLCSKIVNISSDAPPIITECAPSQEADADNDGLAPVPDLTGGVIASSDCGGMVTITQSPLAGTLVGIGTHTITLTATDEANNSSDCETTFTVNDVSAPVITECAGDASAEADANCEATVPDLTGDVVATDNSGSVTVVQNPTPGTVVGVGMHTLTFVVFDDAGNSDECTATFTVEDTTPPSITEPPAEVNAETDPGENFASNVDLGPGPSATDACGLASIDNDAPLTFPVGTNTVIWTVTDNNGNTATTTQLVVVVDNELPMITCPDNITTNLDANVCSLTEVDLGSPVATDNVGIASVSSNAPAVFNVGTNQVIWTATDFEGNQTSCTQIVVLVDATAPTIDVVPGDQQASADDNCEAAVPDFTGGVSATDDCSTGELTVTQSPTAGTLVGLGDTIVTITVTDESGNSTETNVTFTVEDTTAPSITECAGNQNANADENGEAAAPDFTGGVTATDSCSDSGNLTVTQDPVAGTLLGIGEHTITITVTDEAGNSAQCTATFTVNDTTAPVITECAGDQSGSADAGCEAAVPDFTGGVSATDNSGSFTVTQSPTAGTLVGLGTTVVTLTVTDDAGNTAQCTAEFTVTDTTAPSITCPGAVVVSTAPGETTVTNPPLGTPVTADNCGVASVDNDAPSVFPLGDTVVTWTVTDNSGNTASCQQTVTVVPGGSAPVAGNDSYTMLVNDTLTVNAAEGVLANDTGDATLSAVLVNTTTNGTLMLNADGSFTYTPATDFTGVDTFTYRATDGVLTSDVATVTITVQFVGGAGDTELLAGNVSFRQNRNATNRDRLNIRGRINPRGASDNLAGATMWLNVNGMDVSAPVVLDARGRATVVVGNTKIRAMLNSKNGRYRFGVNGTDLDEALGLPNVTGSGFTLLEITLKIDGANLDLDEMFGEFETPYRTVAGVSSTGRFKFRDHRTLTGVFNSYKTVARLNRNGGYVVNFTGAIQNQNSVPILPTGTIGIFVDNQEFALPAGATSGAGVQLFQINSERHLFRLRTTPLMGTEIPQPGPGAPTSYRLPLTLVIPTGPVTNVFETIIELKRPDGTGKVWKR